jgi:hypothetical protein
MADPTTAPAQPTIPDFRNREQFPTRPAHCPQAYDDDLGTLVKQLERQEREHPVEVPPKPFCNPALSQLEYEKQFRERVRKLARG